LKAAEQQVVEQGLKGDKNRDAFSPKHREQSDPTHLI